jgi:hypothetical protein
VERFFWQRYLVQKELDEDLLLQFMYDNNALEKFVSLIDIRNHEKEDNLRSAKFVERAETAKKLIQGLGFSSALDREKIRRETFVENWLANVVENPDFHSKRLNELYNMTKSRRIDKDMTTRQILYWTNTLLKPFGLVIKSDHNKYRLEEMFDIMGLIHRKNKHGKYCIDGENLLGQVREGKDLFIDEETGEVRRKREVVEFDTTRLDVGINED